MKHYAIYGWDTVIHKWIRLTIPITKKEAKTIKDKLEQAKSKKKPAWSKFKIDLYGELKP